MVISLSPDMLSPINDQGNDQLISNSRCVVSKEIMPFTLKYMKAKKLRFVKTHVRECSVFFYLLQANHFTNLLMLSFGFIESLVEHIVPKN